MHVIGTAGHVDHGKSTLVQALTGIDPDRLAEEKAREMTIDLGFAWLTLEINGEQQEVGVVDVPGHRDFIENMLAGVGGIDLALFVVAADEGVMPQTKEHLAILDLLRVPLGLVALTKIDLVEDEDWLELVTLDLSEALAGTVLEDAPIIPVSARTGAGIQALRDALAERLRNAHARVDKGRPRLPIDRVFSLSGFGTVVTGTLLDGSFHLGDAVEVQPAGHQGRIRGLQTHKTKREIARPGSRVAVNVSGVDAEQIRRGDVLALPGVVRGTLLFDAGYRHLPGATIPIRHNMEVKLFTGATEVMARTRVIGARQLDPGESGWLQLALESSVALARGDRFILRRPSPGATLGGGRVLDPHPGRRHRRFRPDVVARFKTLAEGTPAELLLQKLRRQEPVLLRELFDQSGLEKAVAEAAWNELLAEDEAVLLGQYVMTRRFWQEIHERLERMLIAYHRDFPLRHGMPREEVRSRLQLTGTVFNAFLAEAIHDGRVIEQNTTVALAGHQIRFSPEQQRAVDTLMEHFAESGVNSPSVKESREALGNEVYEALVELGQLRQLNDDVVYCLNDYDVLVDQVIRFLHQNETANAGQIRDLLNTSRKYAIAILEHLDQVKITRRVGDERVLAPRILREGKYEPE